MKAIQLRAIYGVQLIGQKVMTEEVGEYPGGEAEVTELWPDPKDDNIVFNVRHPTWRTEDHPNGEIGVFAQEECNLVR